MTIYESTLEKVRKGATFSINFPKRSLKVNGKYVIKNGEYEGNMGAPEDFGGFSALTHITHYYGRYLNSIPSERNEHKKYYFRAKPLKEISEDDMLYGQPREEARFILEFMVLHCIIKGWLVWDDFAKGKWFWQSQTYPSLIILKEWIETPTANNLKLDEKQNLIMTLDQMINGLYEIKAKIMRDEPLVNDDWIKSRRATALKYEQFPPSLREQHKK